MWHYCPLVLMMLATLSSTAWSQDDTYPEGTLDGPCPKVASKFRLNWNRLAGNWNDQMRMPSFFFPDQCPAQTTYGGSYPNITVLVEFTNPDGSTAQILREGVSQRNPNIRVFDPLPIPG
ncbi:unnamed protein product, partial [Meganyctiphanes norvegica]